MKVVDTREYVGMLKELTEEGKEVSMLVFGSSMAPFLIHARDMIYFKKPDRELQKGDIVFFRRKSGQFVMHRIWKIRPEGYYIVGDAQTQIEGPVKREQIFALITKVRRKEKWLEPGDFWWKFYGDSVGVVSADKVDPKAKKVKIAKEKRKDKDVYNVLLVGTDSRDPDADRGRSDSMMMVSFNKKEGKSTAISFLRDSLVDIDGHGKSRLGHTYAYGGVGLTINTINKTYDLDIQNYITISFDDLVNVIDEIGGVTVFISEEEAAYYRENGMPDIQAGDVTLTGSQALAHARNRTLGNDFERTRRQRSVMYGIYRKIMEKKDPSALLPLINYAVNHVRTNMSVSEMYSMAKDVLSVDDLKMQQTCIPQDGTYTDITYEGMQVLKVDFDANKKKIEQLLY